MTRLSRLSLLRLCGRAACIKVGSSRFPLVNVIPSRAAHRHVWDFRQLRVTVHSNPEANPNLGRMHSDFFLSTQTGSTGSHTTSGRRSLLIPNTCAGKGPDLELAAVHAVHIANTQQGFNKEEDRVELDLSDFFLLEIGAFLLGLFGVSLCLFSTCKLSYWLNED